MTRNQGSPRIDVAVGIIRDAHGRVLLGQRPGTGFHPGKWEFPGGKIETGESAHDALVRELHEELGISVVESSPLTGIDYDYPGRPVRLYVRTIDAYNGRIEAREGQPIQWFTAERLQTVDILDANRELIHLLGAREATTPGDR